MKFVIEYESETMLPKAIDKILKQHQEMIKEDCREPDKMTIYFSCLRKDILNWLDDNRKEVL